MDSIGNIFGRESEKRLLSSSSGHVPKMNGVAKMTSFKSLVLHKYYMLKSIRSADLLVSSLHRPSVTIPVRSTSRRCIPVHLQRICSTADTNNIYISKHMLSSTMILPLSLRRRRIPTSFYNHYYDDSIRRSCIHDVTFHRSCCRRNNKNDNNNNIVTNGSSNGISNRWILNSSNYGMCMNNIVTLGYRCSFKLRVQSFTTSTSTNQGTKTDTLNEVVHNSNDDDDHDNIEVSDENIVIRTADSEHSTKLPVFNDEWIPPNRPLMGDVGQAHLYTHIEDDKVLRQLLSEDEANNEGAEGIESMTDPTIQKNDETIVEAEVVPPLTSMDWLKTRRTMLTGQKMMKPDEAALYKQSMTDIELPIIEHMLYTEQELVQFMEAIGGQHVEVVLDRGDTKKGGRRRLGNDVMGIILVTGLNYVQMQSMANQLVRQLRRRRLQEVQVVGAELGVDGNQDDPNENWYVVDCGNYVVHIQDTKTRTAVNLAALWSGRDPIRTVDCTSDEAVDDYVSRYPVPHNYSVGGSIASSSSLLYDVNNWDATMKQFEKSRWTRGNTNMLNAGSSSSGSIGSSRTRFRNKPIVPKRRRKTSGRKT